MSWSNIAEFKLLTGISINPDGDINDVLLQQALDSAVNEIVDKIFINSMYSSRQASIKHFLSGIRSGLSVPLSSSSDLMNFADVNADKIVNVDDLNIFEIDEDFNEYDLAANVIDFKPKYGVIEFNALFPSPNRMLVIEFQTAKYGNDLMQPKLEQMNRLQAVNWLFINVPFQRLQRGISSWTINNVTVSFDLESMQKVMKGNVDELKSLFVDATPMYMRRSRIMRRPLNSRSYLGNYGVAFSTLQSRGFFR